MVLRVRGRRAVLPRAAAVVAAVFVIHLAVALVVGPRGWDDGAITAAFANTFAETGKLSLTPHSEIVEGFSSPFWLILLAATYFVLPLHFDGMILASQLWSAAFAALGAALLFALIRPLIPRAAMPVSIAVFCYGPFLMETANGMEMSALSALALAIVWVVKDRRFRPLALFALAVATPVVRFEASGYVIAGAVILAVFSRDVRRALPLVVGAVVSLFLMTAVRVAAFDSIVANTILAKRWPPYGSESLAEETWQSARVAAELVLVSAPGILVLVLACIGGTTPRGSAMVARLRSRTAHPVIAFSVGYILGVAAFNLAIGYNLGYPGRMEQSAVALGVVAALYCAPRSARMIELPRRLTTYVLALTVITCFSVTYKGMEIGWPPTRSDGVTPLAFRQAGEAVDDVRQRLGLDTISVLLADVGGSSLCCERLEIHDLGLLTNSELAREGYGALGGYLASHTPEVIITKATWSEASGIYDLDDFRTKYVPIVVQNHWLYLRSDLAGRLAGDCQSIPPDAAQDAVNRGFAIDEKYVATLGDTVCRLT